MGSRQNFVAFLGSPVPQCKGHGKVDSQQQRDRRTGVAAKPICCAQSQKAAYKRGQNGEQMILPQIPRQIARGRRWEHEQGVDNHQADPTHCQRHNDGDCDGKERFIALRRHAA